ncbi:transposase is4 [Holotrichia oblita]|uniref:Transposase is4 n=1 Tax=Holotrichia oblita TaxID=644536 RepID=A0ACB9SN44_HOLOL|nr:transposase is4 [Holotrichia oblita]
MDVTFEAGLTLEEALRLAYDDDVTAIYIEPPESNVLTDEDSDDEDIGGSIDKLSGTQLHAQAEVKLANSDRISGRTPCSSSKSQQKQKRSFSWVDGDLEHQSKNSFEAGYTCYKDLSPIELVEKFLADEIMSLLVEQTSRYALFKNFSDPKVSKNEMKCFIVILIISGYVSLPGKRYYWKSQGDMRNSTISEAMRRNRFFEIMKCLHCADNSNSDPNDRMWKLRPYMEKLKLKFLQHYVPEKEMNYDESMIKYYGKHSCKQFIRGKPIRFGYKMWCMNTVSGYFVNCEIYQGKSSKRFIPYEEQFGKAAAPLLSMLDELPGQKRNLPYFLYFDNLLTSINLLENLKERGYHATGTFRENRIPKECPLSDKKTLQKRPRGTHESIIEKESNNVVTMASTCYGVSPITNVKRFSQAEHKIIQIPRPHLNLSRYQISVLANSEFPTFDSQ